MLLVARCCSITLTLLLGVAAAVPAAGQERDQASADQRDAQPVVVIGGPTDVDAVNPFADVDIIGKKMTATATLVPPLLDGLVVEEAWTQAEVISDFLQREPSEGGRPSQRTEVRILFDDRYLYLGFIMYDKPDEIFAQDLRRDSRMQTDDTIAVLLDTFHDHRNGFLFRLNPLGTQYDATVKNESDYSSSWDEKWIGEANITERGWEAEMQIPWSALRYRVGSHVWGIDFKREIRRTNEEVNWSNFRRGFDFGNVSQAGHLVGLRNLKLTDRFRLKPYVAGDYSSLQASETPLSTGSGTLGIEDFKVQVTPNLTADLTVNTDFAQVEGDEERVNLTRFPLFYSERREFFLEGADKFTFGDSDGGMGGPSFLAYHSRNIGLYDGTPVPMLYGAKMTGKLGSTSIGLINAQTRPEQAVEYGGRNYTALRMSQDVLRRSSIGLVFTNVQDGGTYNRVGGVDASFRIGDYAYAAGYMAAAMDSEIAGTRWIGSMQAGYESDLWSGGASLDYVDADFEAELGFVRRRDMVRQNYWAGWKPRPGWSWMRQIRLWSSLEYIADTRGEIQTREVGLSSRFQFESGDGASLRLEHTFERLLEAFFPSDLAEIPAGDYNFNTWSASIDTYSARRLSGRLRLGGGGYYSGTRNSAGSSLTFRFNEKFSLSPSYDFNRVALPEDGFDTHVVGLRGSYNFSDRWLTSALVQYNSVADRLSVFARLNFIYRNGDDIFLVYKSTVRYDPEFYGQMDQALIAKMTRSWDF